MARPSSLSERARYAFDNSMAGGTPALIGWLSVATFGFLAVATVLLSGLGIHPDAAVDMGVIDTFWFGLMHMLDAGTVVGDEGSWVMKLAMLGVTLGGLFILSTLIGVITNGVEAKVDELRKGRSRVIERDHTLILGWSEQVFTILSELVVANESKRRACVVVLAPADKVEMDDAIRERLPDLKSTVVVCRSGSPTDLSDLAMVGVNASKSVIVLSPEGDDPDASVIKSILAITNGPDRRKAPYHIVAVITEPSNMEAAKLVGRDEAEIVLSGDLISRIMVQTCRQSGLSVVHIELLDFGGGEIYFKEEPSLLGRAFGEVLFAYEESTIIGLRRASGQVMLNPPMEEKLLAGDRVIAVSEDDDTVVLSGRTPVIDQSAIVEGAVEPAKPESTLVLGWNWRAPLVLNGLDAYVAPGSSLLLVTELDEEATGVREACGDMKHQALTYRKGETTSRKLLESLDVASFDHIIVLCSDTIDPQRADSRVLVTLLHLRDMGEKLQRDLSIVTEMLDSRNRELAEVTNADDFIVSEKLVSLLLTQISENKELAPVFEDLFDPDGSEIYLKPITNYIKPGMEVDFYTVTEAARRRGEIAIGYKVASLARDGSASYGVVVNPNKAGRIKFSADDKLVVVAES